MFAKTMPHPGHNNMPGKLLWNPQDITIADLDAIAELLGHKHGAPGHNIIVQDINTAHQDRTSELPGHNGNAPGHTIKLARGRAAGGERERESHKASHGWGSCATAFG